MKIINKELLDSLTKEAQSSPRKRKNLNFHPALDDPMNRMLNALEPDTYTTPHKHENPDKREVFIVLRGRLAVFFFDNSGKITHKTILDKEVGVFGIEVLPRTWHSVLSLESGSVVYELKDGPYEAHNDKIFAPWAPTEGSSEVDDYMKFLRKAALVES
ncbi:MAG: WbuC family cupin fold metalloprotein [Cytophagaceae bacterium]|jgi:cupin fold WbuC family metalloprotein|nr:WbuC family cupin fold metalloprotein [Cytophagaceae bacterium]